MKLIKKHSLLLLNWIIVVSICFVNVGAALAYSTTQIAEKNVDTPLYPGLEWTTSQNIQKDVRAYGRSSIFTGNSYAAIAIFPDKNPESIFDYYSSENLQSLGWNFIGGIGVELVYRHVSETFLTVKIEQCSNSGTEYCLTIWQSTKFIGLPNLTELESSPAPKIIGYNKTTPANGSTVSMSDLTNTYYLLQWTDALIDDTDRYQYCIDETNNNSCDSSWITRDSLYSGGPSDFTLVSGHTYYWQVRTRDTDVYANGGAWWSFTVTKTSISFNKTTPLNGSTIDMPDNTYYLLQWTDAGLPDTDRYQYCIDETNNNSCDSSWVTRDSLYSGGPGDFALAYGHTYYWQVRARDADVYANSGAWWSFTIPAIMAPPSVTSIVRSVPTSAVTNNASVVFGVNFSQPVTGVDISDFTLTTTDLVGASITSVSGTDYTNTRTVTVNRGAGTGTIRLNLVDDDTIKNIQTTPLGGLAAGNGNFSTGEAYTIASAYLVNSLLPTSRTGAVSNSVTIFHSVVNIGVATATSVTLSMSPAPTGTFTYTQTNCATNAVIGSPNAALDIPAGGTACYVLSFTPSVAFSATQVHIKATATNALATTLLPGVNTWLLRATAAAGPDIIALTTTTDFHQVACSGAQAFAVAISNVGAAASGNVTVSANTGSTSLPISISIQETDPVTGSIIGDNILNNLGSGENRTVAVFVSFNGCVSFDPAANRIFIEFRDASNNVLGSTSTAISTNR